MSIRRTMGEVALLDDEDGSPPYLGRIVAHSRGAKPDACVRDCGDPQCREWPVVEVVNAPGESTGEMIFHVPECRMATPPTAR